MFLSPLSEFYGRRIVYIVAFGMYLIWLIPCALAPNIGAMLVVRFLDGLAVSPSAAATLCLDGCSLMVAGKCLFERRWRYGRGHVHKGQAERTHGRLYW